MAPHIGILSASIRTGRNSHRVALYFQQYLAKHQLASVELIDLQAYAFPVFEERLSLLPNPSAGVVAFAEKIKAVDGLVMVVPEYNGGYPAALKNAIDLLYAEWYRKPIAIATVSAGDFGGSQLITSLQFSLWKMRAWTVPAVFAVPRVGDAFTETGEAVQLEATDKRAKSFLDELFWCVEANKRMA